MDFKDKLVTAAISSLAAIGTGLLVAYIQQREPKLIYIVEQSQPILTEKNEWWSIQSITFQNIGNKEASNLVGEIDLSSSTEIKNATTGLNDPTLNIKVSCEEHSCRTEAKSLNPHEEFKITLLNENKTGDMENPEVFFRGEGVTGHNASQAIP